MTNNELFAGLFEHDACSVLPYVIADACGVRYDKCETLEEAEALAAAWNADPTPGAATPYHVEPCPIEPCPWCADVRCGAGS